MSHTTTQFFHGPRAIEETEGDGTCVWDGVIVEPIKRDEKNYRFCQRWEGNDYLKRERPWGEFEKKSDSLQLFLHLARSCLHIFVTGGAVSVWR